MPISFTDEQIAAVMSVYDLAYARGSSEGRNSLRGRISSALEFEDVP